MKPLRIAVLPAMTAAGSADEASPASAALEVDGYDSFSHRSTVADENGAFAFPRLGGGRASLAMLAIGFETYSQKHEFGSFSETIAVRLRRLAP